MQDTYSFHTTSRSLNSVMIFGFAVFWIVMLGRMDVPIVFNVIAWVFLALIAWGLIRNRKYGIAIGDEVLVIAPQEEARNQDQRYRLS